MDVVATPDPMPLDLEKLQERADGIVVNLHRRLVAALPSDRKLENTEVELSSEKEQLRVDPEAIEAKHREETIADVAANHDREERVVAHAARARKTHER
jgi:hypothetical protein